MSSSYRMELDKWLASLEVKADRVLDIGGAQVTMPKRVKSWDVKEYLIADLPQPHEGDIKPDIELDLNRPYLPQALRAWADLVFCLEVFDYVWDPFGALDTINYSLRLGGTAWVSFPSFYPLHQPVADDALRYMPGGIQKLADSIGLEIVQMIKRRPETNSLEQAWRAERMRAAKHEDHHFTGFIVEFKK